MIDYCSNFRDLKFYTNRRNNITQIWNSSLYWKKIRNDIHPKESHRASAIESSIRDIGLTGEIFGVLYRCDHPFHREESCQICSVRRDDNQSEEPPYAAHNTRARSLIKKISLSG